jgi:hypothetical protein
MARTIRTSQMKNITMPGIAYPRTFTTFASSAGGTCMPCPGKRDLTIPAHTSHRRALNLAIRYTTRLEQAGAITSAGSRGDRDNALAETITGLYKAELIRHRGPWHSMALVEAATAW